MTRLCPYRFKEFADAKQQECIGHDCMRYMRCKGESEPEASKGTSSPKALLRMDEMPAHTMKPPKLDTREELEKDVREHFSNDHDCDPWLDECAVTAVMAFLDRQAAITEREVTARDAEQLHEVVRENVEGFEEAIKELRVERNRLRHAVETMGGVVLTNGVILTPLERVKL